MKRLDWYARRKDAEPTDVDLPLCVGRGMEGNSGHQKDCHIPAVKMNYAKLQIFRIDLDNCFSVDPNPVSNEYCFIK